MSKKSNQISTVTELRLLWIVKCYIFFPYFSVTHIFGYWCRFYSDQVNGILERAFGDSVLFWPKKEHGLLKCVRLSNSVDCLSNLQAVSSSADSRSAVGAYRLSFIRLRICSTFICQVLSAHTYTFYFHLYPHASKHIMLISIGNGVFFTIIKMLKCYYTCMN